jgi:hypothetical protein
LSALIPLAVQAIRIAFRLGSRVAIVGGQLESCRDKLLPWSTIVLGISHGDAEAALADFNKNEVKFLDPDS